MKIKKNGKVIKLTESDLQKIVKRVISEQEEAAAPEEEAKKKNASVRHTEKDKRGKELTFILQGSEYKGKKFPNSPYIIIGEKGKYQRIKRNGERGANAELKGQIARFHPSQDTTTAGGGFDNFINAVKSAGYNVTEIIPSLDTIKKAYFSREGNSDYQQNYGVVGPQETVDLSNGYEVKFRPIIYYDGVTKKPKFKRLRTIYITTNRGDKYFIKSSGNQNPASFDIRKAKTFRGSNSTSGKEIVLGDFIGREDINTLISGIRKIS